MVFGSVKNNLSMWASHWNRYSQSEIAPTKKTRPANKKVNNFFLPEEISKSEIEERIIPSAVFTFIVAQAGLKLFSASTSSTQPIKAMLPNAIAKNEVITVTH